MAGNRPVFSIITPSYNQGSFLAESMQSVLSQNRTGDRQMP